MAWQLISQTAPPFGQRVRVRRVGETLEEVVTRRSAPADRQWVKPIGGLLAWVPEEFNPIQETLNEPTQPGEADRHHQVTDTQVPRSARTVGQITSGSRFAPNSSISAGDGGSGGSSQSGGSDEDGDGTTSPSIELVAPGFQVPSDGSDGASSDGSDGASSDGSSPASSPASGEASSPASGEASSPAASSEVTSSEVTSTPAASSGSPGVPGGC